VVGIRSKSTLPLQVSAICYRRTGPEVELLLVNTNSGGKWTFPKGDPADSMSHSRAAEREAWEEAGVRGYIEREHFHLYLYSKGVFWKPPGVREFVVKAFLFEVSQEGFPAESDRNPTWFRAEEAKKRLVKGREVKYAREMEALVDRALEQILSRPSEPPKNRSTLPSPV
jgi:8-oxo-dGTP pyrophosphatase MutT (NUDIX family)